MPRTAVALSIVLLLASAPAFADEATLEAEEAASEHLDGLDIEFPDALQLVPRLTLPWAGGTHVRFSQELMGIPVYGHEVIVSLDSTGAVRRVIGEPLSVVLLDTRPELAADVAVASADALVRARFGGTGAFFEPTAHLEVFVGRDEIPRLVWSVATSTATPPGNYQVLVDAHNGHFVDIQSTLKDARGNIYPTNPTVSELTEDELPPIDDGVDGMQGDYAYVNSCDEAEQNEQGGSTCVAKSRHAEADADGNFLFSPDPASSDDPLAEVQMYYHLDLVARWFDEEQGFSHGAEIEGIVNFDYNNAFYGNFDSDPYFEVAFGQTSFMDFAYDADVIYHEFGHSVFGRIAGQTGGFAEGDEYGMDNSTGGLNEGTADLFALVLTGDPQLGEYASAGFGQSEAIRDLEEDRHCPTDLYGESHADGEIFGAFGWNLIDDDAIGADLTGDYIFGSVAAFPVNANWGDASEALVNTAADMLDEELIDADQHATIVAHLEAAGLQQCGRVIRLDEGQEPTQQMFAVSFFEEANIPLGNQFSLDAPEGTYRIRFRVKDWLAIDSGIAWNLYVRRGTHVFHDIVEVETPYGFVSAPVPTDFDFMIEGEGDDFDLELTFDSDPPLEPGATYYFSMASRVEGGLDNYYAAAAITVDGDAYIEEIDEPDPEEGTGCQSCSGSLSGGASAGLLALLLAVGTLPRRRFTRPE